MIAWPALERAAQQAGWKRNGRTWRGAPCPSCGGGTRDTAWVGPGTTAAFRRGVQRARDRGPHFSDLTTCPDAMGEGGPGGSGVEFSVDACADSLRSPGASTAAPRGIAPDGPE